MKSRIKHKMIDVGIRVAGLGMILFAWLVGIKIAGTMWGMGLQEIGSLLVLFVGLIGWIIIGAVLCFVGYLFIIE